MTTDELKTLLQQDIKTSEQWERVNNTLSQYAPAALHTQAASTRRFWEADVNPAARADAVWWVYRQAWRQALGVYPAMTEALKKASRELSLGHTLPHVSPIDPTQVAYTASAADGERDKVTRSTIGRWMRRWCVLVSDSYIQKIEQEHASELDPTIKVAVTPKDIEYLYRRAAGGTGCMRYASSNWGLRHHPSIVYASPETGLGVAYDGEIGGEVRSRAVVYVNPEDPQDKRYVRVYGAPQLESKLIRAGYRCAALTGARLRKVSTGERGEYILPYLDGPGGDQGAAQGRRVALLSSAPDHLTVLDEGVGGAIGAVVARTISGAVRLKLLDAGEIEFTCAITGVHHDLRKPAKRVRLVRAGQPDAWVAASALDRRDPRGYDYVTRDVLTPQGEDRVAVVECEESELVAEARCGRTYLKRDEDALIASGSLVRLDAQWYGEGAVARLRVAADCAVTGRKMMEFDGVPVVLDDLTIVQAHESVVRKRSGGQREWAALHKVGGKTVYARKGDAHVVTTVSGAKVIPEVHDVVRKLDGQWDFERNCSSIADLFGMRVGLSSRGDLANVSEELIREAMERRLGAVMVHESDSDNLTSALLAAARGRFALDGKQIDSELYQRLWSGTSLGELHSKMEEQTRRATAVLEMAGGSLAAKRVAVVHLKLWPLLQARLRGLGWNPETAPAPDNADSTGNALQDLQRRASELTQ